MRLNGMVHVTRKRDGTYMVTYTPLGVPLSCCLSRSFRDQKELEDFLADPLQIDRREITAALNALFRHGRYCVYEVWLSEEVMKGHGLGPVSPLSVPLERLYDPAQAVA